MAKAVPNYWVFSNKPAGTYGGNIWDHGTTLKSKRYYFREDEKSRRRVKAGDIAILRTFGHGYVGQFEVGDWHGGEEWKGKDGRRHVIGYYDVKKMVAWKRELPQALILKELSNRDVRSRLIPITGEDALKIDTGRRLYERLGYGSADGDVVLLEKGLEEALKPNLPRLGLKLAAEGVRQQFSMGVGVGRSDLICEDDKGALVVMELKRGRSSDEVVGQVLRYIGFVRENVATKGQDVRGCIVTGDYDESLRLAASAAGIRLLRVRLP
jgi:hypothetical protein